MDKIVENLPGMCTYITGLIEVDDKYSELEKQMHLLDSTVKDMMARLNEEEANNPCRKRKHAVEFFFNQVNNFKTEANMALEICGGPRRWRRLRMVHQRSKCVKGLKAGKDVLDMADQLQRDGLTQYEICTRGVRLPVENLIGKTANDLRKDVLRAIIKRTPVIGIHGNFGSGKTNLMKVLHNDVFDDTQRFKAVFWARAPEEQFEVKGIQDCLADAMRFKLEDEDVVRRASLLAQRLKVMAPGHVVVCLDNVKEHFLTNDVGIPIDDNESEAENFCCTLVFTSTSENVCNRMRRFSEFSKFKMDLLPEDEARELFLREAVWNKCLSYDRKILKAADEVARQCARMPLAIITIARSMLGKEDICEWRNQLNEMIGVVQNIHEHDNEAKILEQLKFSFHCLKDTTIRRCFLASPEVLLEGRQVPSQELIQHWISEGLIGKRHCTGLRYHSVATATDDQGQTIINELQRAYLLEVIKLNGVEFVEMNKWIRKMAEST